eukprot:m.15338 g.15338  ORF g.15338 m.15338 type:complete len:862 (+) comp3429_c0_seq1:93-2678(+)
MAACELSDADLPSWFHGRLGRDEAESILASNGGKDGLFLVRESPSTGGYVLSLCSSAEPGGRIHYQIRAVDTPAGRRLVLDTETEGASPMFVSLSGVMQYLLRSPQALSCPLRSWCARILEPPAPTPEAPPTRPSIASSLLGAVQDALSSNGLSSESPRESWYENPSALNDAPQLLVRTGSDRNPGVDIVTGEIVPTLKGDILTPMSMEVDDSGEESVICRNQHGRLLRFPAGCDMAVLPMGLETIGPPPVPSRTQRPPLRSRQSLSDVITEAGGLSLTSRREDPDCFFRDIIMEGYLYKLPPAGNRVQIWRKRYFKVAINIHRVISVGPVMLEYYSRPKDRQAKGIIDLDPVVRISRPNFADELVAKRFKGIDKTLCFEIELPLRTYCIHTDKSADVDRWIMTLKDIMGMTPEPSRPPSPMNLGDRREFKGTILNREIKNHDGILVCEPMQLILKCPQTSATLKAWSYLDLHLFGFVRQVFWFELEEGSGTGIFCFSTPDASSIYRAVDYFLGKSGRTSRKRDSRRHNMSWSSVQTDSVRTRTPSVAAEKGPITLFGKVLSPEDLQPVAIAVALRSYTARSPREFDMHEGQAFDVSATREFVDEGFWLACEPGSRERKLLPVALVQLQDHEFGNLRDMDDALRGSADSLLEGVDTQMFDFGFPDAGAQPDVVVGSIENHYMEPNSRPVGAAAAAGPAASASNSQPLYMAAVPDPPYDSTTNPVQYYDSTAEVPKPLPSIVDDVYEVPVNEATKRKLVIPPSVRGKITPGYINSVISGVHGDIPPVLHISGFDGLQLTYQPQPEDTVSDAKEAIAACMQLAPDELELVCEDTSVDLSDDALPLRHYALKTKLVVSVLSGHV